ncbi:ALC-interacting protein [Senna tora]|uniref:ALC-interacting protein n=1 Tax=Senna tora TaxID=362788 RepID=A0A834WQF0_9FABA|nr:ALC-interacting protein [Senna tora]
MAIPHQDPAKPSGCFSSFLRLLLCASQSNHAPPLIHPSDDHHLSSHYSHSHSQTPSCFFHPNKPNANSESTIPAPGLVARLMGLDSLPNTSRVSNRVAPESVPRSRSVNFIDYLVHEEPASHRRARTSSFREAPTTTFPSLSFHQQNDHEIVVLLLDDENCRKQRKKKEKEEEQMKKKKKISKLKDEPRRECVSPPRARKENYKNGCGNRNSSSNGSSCALRRRRMGKEEAFVEPRFRKSVREKKSLTTKKKKKKQSSECCYENLSPVSVLDVSVGGDDGDFTFPNQTPFSGVEEERGRSNNEGKYTETEYWLELMEKVMKLTEDEVRESDWRGKKSMFEIESEIYKEISLVFERRIFDLLLGEVVHELVQF